MGGSFLGFAIEALVAVLLAVTIGYCVLVNRKLAQLRSDQSELKEIVRDLNDVTTQADKAIAGLKQNAQSAEEALVRRIEEAKTLEEKLKSGISSGDALLAKLTSLPRTRAAQGADATGVSQETRQKPLRQSAVGLGMLNAQRRGEDEKPARPQQRQGAAA